MRFTVRRPPSGEVSPCGHRPSGGDVACSVDVGVAPSGGAGFALEDRLALAVSGCDVPACGATLRRVRGRDLLDPAESLVLQTRDELTPATSADRAVEPTLLGDSRARLLDGAARGTGHRPHVKGLDSDHVESPREVGGRFLHPVLAPIPLAGFQLRDRPLRLLAAVGTALGAGQPLLQHLQPFRLTRAKTGCMQQFAGRQRGRHGNTAVDADHAAVARTGDRIGDVREGDMPAASPIPGNPVGLHTLWHRPRQAKSHPARPWAPTPDRSGGSAARRDAVSPRPVETLRAHRLYATSGGGACRRRSSASPARNPAAPAAAPSDSRREATRTRHAPPSTAHTARHSREPCGPVASAVAAPPPNSTHTARPGSAPTMPPPAQESATVGTATYPHRNRRHRHPRP